MAGRGSLGMSLLMFVLAANALVGIVWINYSSWVTVCGSDTTCMGPLTIFSPYSPLGQIMRGNILGFFSALLFSYGGSDSGCELGALDLLGCIKWVIFGIIYAIAPLVMFLIAFAANINASAQGSGQILASGGGGGGGFGFGIGSQGARLALASGFGALIWFLSQQFMTYADWANAIPLPGMDLVIPLVWPIMAVVGVVLIASGGGSD